MSIFIVVGGPLAGKKTLVSGAKTILKESEKYAFVSNVTTRIDATKDPKTGIVERELSPVHEVAATDEEFIKTKGESGFAFTWEEANEKKKPSRYGVPKSMLEDLDAKKKVILIIPRPQLADFEKQFNSYTVKYISITVPAHLLISRDKKKVVPAKGAKDDKKVPAKGAPGKAVDQADMTGPNVITISNGSTPEDGVSDFLNALGYNPDTDFLPPPNAAFDMRKCPPQEYLKRVLFPALAPAMHILEVTRPTNPIEFLALTLIQNDHATRVQTGQLSAIHDMKSKLREQYKKDYLVNGRI